MKRLKTTKEKYIKLWNCMKGNLCFNHRLERYPWETDEEYQARLYKHYNPDMPVRIIYHTKRGYIEISIG